MVLYRIDSLHGLRYDSNSTHLHHLRPLLVFPDSSEISCVKFGSKIYFFGLDYYFLDNYDPSIDHAYVYSMEEKDLMGIEPSEDNIITKFEHLLTKTKRPMHSYKWSPYCFVANNKLYVLTRWSNPWSSFEVFSPVDETWQLLPSPYTYQNMNEPVLSHLVDKEHIVYFSTCDDFFSFNLETLEWKAASNHAWCRQATLVGEMAFGFIGNFGVKHICASKPFSRGEEVMQPYLAPDRDFLEVLRSSRFTYIIEGCYTDYIVALQDSDNKQVLCIVTYGRNTNPIWDPDTTTSYLALSFFGIPGNFFTKISPVQGMDTSYAQERAIDGGVIRRYFNAEFQYTKHFTFTNSFLNTNRNTVNFFL
ncbi:F-box domain-containing protein [Heracleum sosnowskyi]|uniref:F-box domain-containing protein n=1 Tax=Heracleum sosnowskyi TaxID=360622 RepID=A0AAD8MIB3_9APIA|nr:F-box domain-containing protein [Heracleum sosnowskyi]